jgi:hypothetical protein
VTGKNTGGWEWREGGAALERAYDVTVMSPIGKYPAQRQLVDNEMFAFTLWEKNISLDNR